MSTMRATVLTNYVDVVRQLGLSPEKLLRTVGLSPQMLSTPDRLIPSDAVVRLLESAAEQSGCEVVGLRMSEPRGLSQFGVVGLLLNQQPTLRDALQMARYAFDFIESVAGAATEPLAAEVRRSIYLLLPLGQATVKQVAESRGCSVRKLQLDLGRIGTSFAQLLDDARRERAQLYLGNPRFEIGQTAALLGYRHQSAFTRWFAGRFGMPPSEWQVKANAHGAPGPTLPDALRAQRDGW